MDMNSELSLEKEMGIIDEPIQIEESEDGSSNISSPQLSTSATSRVNIRLTLNPEWAEELKRIAKRKSKTRLDLIRDYLREGAAKDAYADPNADKFSAFLSDNHSAVSDVEETKHSEDKVES